MNDLLISLLVFAIIFGGALIGMVVRPWLSEDICILTRGTLSKWQRV
jgi:hypothetical protein